MDQVVEDLRPRIRAKEINTTYRVWYMRIRSVRMYVCTTSHVRTVPTALYCAYSASMQKNDSLRTEKNFDSLDESDEFYFFCSTFVCDFFQLS